MAQCEHLELLFGACFHQDWSLEASDWQGVIENFVEDAGQACATATADSLRALLLQPSDAALERKVMSDYGCCYMPRPDLGDVGIRGWLRQLCAELDAHASRA
ncbi:MAG: hypothetical protein JJU06_09495 [Ectothiorhodospiraceae bacterium]|nr:hypothetical protein [Ectothiorhodospiraceae bacterium]MCH8506912.1 hypothetical protein [Ectothiorhodospiraceae bacterium]